MDRPQLLQHFDTLAETPDAIEKLRKLVLDLAIQGRLAPQDTNDEPVSKLVTRIRTAMESFNKTGRSKPSDDGDKTTLEVPKTWAWVRFGDIVRIRTGKLDANAAVEGGDYPFFTCSQTPSRIATYSFDTSAVLLAGNGDFNLKYYVGKFDAYQRTYVIEPLGWDLRFCFTLMSSQIRRITENNRGSAIPYLKLGDISEVFVPLPPLAEQRRIVAKVEELLALCDALEAAQTAAREHRTRLVRSALDHLTTAKDESEFCHHATFVLQHSDLVLDSVSVLRRAILQLAVQGKLGTQTKGEKVAVSIREIRPQAELFAAPENWRWTEFGEVAVIAGGFAFKSVDYAPSGIFVLRVTNIEPSGIITKTDAVFLSDEKITDEVKKFYLNAGEILLVMVGGSLGKIGIVTEDVLPALLNQNLWRITPAKKDVDNQFLKLLTDFTVSFQRKIIHSTHGHLSREEFRGKPIALPPLAEQRRIVAKVEELLALCAELEAAQTAAQTTAEHLLDATLHQILAA